MDRKQQVMHEFGGKYFGSKESLPNKDREEIFFFVKPWILKTKKTVHKTEVILKEKFFEKNITLVVYDSLLPGNFLLKTITLVRCLKVYWKV